MSDTLLVGHAPPLVSPPEDASRRRSRADRPAYRAIMHHNGGFFRMTDPRTAGAAPSFGAVPDDPPIAAPVTGIELSISFGPGGMAARLVALSPGETPGRPDGRTVPVPERHLPALESVMVGILADLTVLRGA
jgi:hypothetical protein